MAIIIPSRCIYNLQNDKVIDNKIIGVSYEQNSNSYSDTIYWSKNGEISSATANNELKIYGNWKNINANERKRIYVNLSQKHQNSNVSFSNSLDNISSWQEMWLDFTSTITNSIDSTSKTVNSKIRAVGKTPYVPLAPDYDVDEEIIYNYANYLIKNYARVLIDWKNNSLIFFVYADKVSIYIETETYSNGAWTLANTENVYTVSVINHTNFTLYQSKNTSSNETIVNGNKNASYSLSSNALLTSTARIDGKTLGTHISDKIIEDYGNGKETATIVCSISNYYDELGNQVKFDDNGDNMFFDIYDAVVPMKYNALGKDAPISITSDFKAKTFGVLGVEIFYDGAVWQRLILQETGESIEILQYLSAPTIWLDGDTLNITDTSGVAEKFEVYANGTLATTLVGHTTLDLTALNLEAGDYTITVVARASGYKPSGASNSVSYFITKIIKAGTYVLNETINVAKNARYELSDEILVNIYNGSTIQQFSKDITIIFRIPSSFDANLTIAGDGEFYTEYSSSWKYVDSAGDSSKIPNEYLLDCRTITITADIEVNQDFYEVFMANVIKKN